jgi:hypothetical protein
MPFTGLTHPYQNPYGDRDGATHRNATSAASRSRRGTDSLRGRSPGVWEIRVVVGCNPGDGRSSQRSFTFHGDAEFAEWQRPELVHRGRDPGSMSHLRAVADRGRNGVP